ncbi:FAS1-like dehydratase domain-containing protein [Haladaptatus halobius]|uniref:FAS1-like dehydratase domain-containing protein n=1 Tax=Haladaptatus halobius TaxID=2884875 RepID=UPI001D0BCDD3|nr:MaoC family dehydratase N-terminal domain-containing protein [Haladaptatus halobius]
MSSEIDLAAHEDDIGRTETYDIGRVTPLMARRYARAVEDDNPLFHDEAVARERGYDNVIVPPNFLSAIIDPTEGAPADQLREDGLNPQRFPIELPPEAILMGGGQDLSIHRYVTAGEYVSVEETLTDVYQRDSEQMGTLTFIEQTAEYYGDDDDHVLTCDKTMIVGDRQ